MVVRRVGDEGGQGSHLALEVQLEEELVYQSAESGVGEQGQRWGGGAGLGGLAPLTVSVPIGISVSGWSMSSLKETKSSCAASALMKRTGLHHTRVVWLVSSLFVWLGVCCRGRQD